jgi:hypothetical protein
VHLKALVRGLLVRHHDLYGSRTIDSAGRHAAGVRVGQGIEEVLRRQLTPSTLIGIGEVTDDSGSVTVKVSVSAASVESRAIRSSVTAACPTLAERRAAVDDLAAEAQKLGLY